MRLTGTSVNLEEVAARQVWMKVERFRCASAV